MYFKILKDDLTHHGYTYHEGLNVDENPFDSTQDCGGGLFFTDEKHILEFCDYGDKIAEVIIPEGEKIIKVEDKYKAHRIILGEIKDLWEVETFKWLSKCGVDIHASGNYAFICAASRGNSEAVKHFIEYGVDIQTYDNAALIWAAEGGHFEILKYLIEHGADIHEEDDLILFRAVAEGNLEIVKYLIAHGANINEVDDALLECAEDNGHTEVIKYLMRHFN